MNPDQQQQYAVGVDFGTLFRPGGGGSGRRRRGGRQRGPRLPARRARPDPARGVVRGRSERRAGAEATDFAATDEALPPDWALQVPSDYLDVLKAAVPKAVAKAGIDPGRVIGIGTDFTASSPLPTLADGTALCELPRYAGRPHAYVKLWKHHAAQPQADRINAVARERAEPWLSRYGGLISSEWEFAKALQLLEEDPDLYAAMQRWVEAADWIVWRLCGRYLRNGCTAGYKGIRQDGRYPSRAYLAALNPDFAGFVEEKLDQADVPPVRWSRLG